MPLILIVDDDRAIVDVLQLALSQYRTIFASDGASALYLLDSELPDLVLLDLRMADMDGAVVLIKIREKSDVPVIVLSARHEQADVVQALNAGADDFIDKPFDLADLEARVEAVLRRAKREPIPLVPELRVGLLTMSDPKGPRMDGVVVHLSPTETRLLSLLMEHQGETVPRDVIAKQLWGIDSSDGLSGIPGLVSNHIRRLRARLRHQCKGAPTIETRRGRGFSLVPQAHFEDCSDCRAGQRGPRHEGRGCAS